jgi:hypothetical protein
MDDGDWRYPSAAQKWLWRSWQDFLGTVAEQRTDRLVVVLNGDVFEGGGHHGNTQFVSLNQADEERIAIECLEPLAALQPDEVYFVRGTGAHTGPSSANETRLARYFCERQTNPLNVMRDEERDSWTWWMLPLEVEGVRIDFAHHGRRGTRPWTEANAVQMLAAEIVYRHAQEPEELWPHLVFTAHVHLCRDSGQNFPIQVWTQPAWQLKTEWNWKVHAFGVADVGGLIVQCDAGEYSIGKHIYQPPRRPRCKSSTKIN